MKARAFAIARRTLESASRPGRPTKAALDDALAGARGGDAAAASELAYGVVRRRRSLRAAIGGVARRAFKGRSQDVELALELGAFGVLFLRPDDRAAAIAASVALVQGGKKPRRRVEDALERLAAAIADRVPEAALPPGALDEGRALPLPGGEALLFARPLLELDGASAARRLAILYSYPDDLAKAWVAQLGAEVAARVAAAGDEPPPLFARVNALKTTPEVLVRKLAGEGVVARPHATLPHALLLDEGRGGFRGTASWKEGLFTIQDPTAQEVVLLLAPRAGERVLDLCAAPGGKTTYAAELSGDRAAIVATDLSPGRLRKVGQALERLGIRGVETRPLDEATSGPPFDAVLVDAPCSNTGVLRRRPEARWRYTPRSQRKLVSKQARILAGALGLVRPGGRCVYSVCSIEREEGPDLVKAVLGGAAGGFTVVKEVTRLPETGGGDGGYAGVIVRTG